MVAGRFGVRQEGEDRAIGKIARPGDATNRDPVFRKSVDHQEFGPVGASLRPNTSPPDCPDLGQASQVGDALKIRASCRTHRSHNLSD